MKHLLLFTLLTVTLASASASSATVAASTPDSISYMPVLLNQPAIHKDLQISPVQDARIDIIRAECRAKVGVLSAEGLLDPALSPTALKNLPSYQVHPWVDISGSGRRLANKRWLRRSVAFHGVA